jgi:hypothetical protein
MERCLEEGVDYFFDKNLDIQQLLFTDSKMAKNYEPHMIDQDHKHE